MTPAIPLSQALAHSILVWLPHHLAFIANTSTFSVVLIVPLPAPVYYLLYQSILLEIVYSDSSIGGCPICLGWIYLSEIALFIGGK